VGYSQSQLIRNLLDLACESQDKSARNKEFIGPNYNEAARTSTKPGINHESTRYGMVFTNCIRNDVVNRQVTVSITG
jgi:hypothetical protein